MAKLKVTRGQFAEFIDNHDTIKQFEKLFDHVNSLIAPDVVEITDTVNIVKSFPFVVDVMGSQRIYRRTGAGAGTFTLNTRDSEELILLDGTSVSSIVLSGEETLEIYASEGKLWVLVN